MFNSGESEILQPVRPANDGPTDRPTIDDMIERLQQEQQNQGQNQDNRDSNESGPSSSNDNFRTPRNTRRLQNNRDDSRSAQDSFSPRTPRSQAGINTHKFMYLCIIKNLNESHFYFLF